MEQQGVLDYYFGKCPEFIDLLDIIREKHESQEYHQLSLFICHILKIPMHEIGLVQLYLFTGKYNPSVYFPNVAVVTGEDIYTAEYPDKKAVYLHLLPDTSRDDVLNFIEHNWQEVRGTLNENFPKRKRTTKPIDKLNDWLTIAERVYKYTKQKDFNKEAFYADLAVEFDIEPSDVKAYAKQYRPLMDLKYPLFESDFKNDNL